MSGIRYPDGRTSSYEKKENAEKPKRHILSASNRGMDFEADINEANDYYKEKGLALLNKRPTPINVVKVDYSKGARITSAYFEKQSTTDYNGVYKGKYLDFEAKETKSKTSFSLANIAPHQVDHLEGVMEHGGFAFFLIYLSTLDEAYLLKADYICRFYRDKPRKSIPVADIRKNGYRLKEGFRPRYDFLPAVDLAFGL